MHDPSRTYQEVIEENALLKQRIEELELSELALKQAEKALRESEAQKNAILNGITTNIAFVDNDLKIIWVNKTAAESINKSPDEMIGHTCHELWADPSIPCKDCPTLKAFQTQKSEHTIMYTPDERIWDERGEPVFDTEGKMIGVVEIAQDITDRKRVEQELRVSEEKFREMVETLPLAIYLSVGIEQKCEYLNPMFIKLFGYALEDIPTVEQWWPLAYPDENYRRQISENWTTRVKRAIETKSPIEPMDVMVTCKDGSKKNILWGYITLGEKNYAYGLDLTERMRAEEALRESEERYKIFVEKSLAGVYVVQDNRFLFLNDNAASFAGYKPEELIGRKSDIIVHPDDRETIKEKVKKMLSGEDLSPYEFRIVTKDEKTRWIMETVTFIQYNGRKAILGNSMDITDRKWAEEELHASQELERSILLSVPYGLFGVEQRRIFFANNAMEDIFGWKPDELIGKSTRIIFRNDKEWEEYGALLYSKLKMQPVFVFEWDTPFIRKDGRGIFCRMSVSRTGRELEENRRIVATFEDITDHKRAEDALRQSELTLRSVFLAAPVGICIMKNRLYQRANAFWCESFGHPEESIIGTDTRTLYENDEEYDRVGQDLYKQLQQRGVASADTRLRRSDGVFRDVILTAALLRADDTTAERVVIIQDVTERKRAENELIESRRRLSDIIEFLPDATFVIDRDEKVIAWNRAIETVTGIKKEDMLGKGNYEYAIPFYGHRRPILIDLALHPDKAKEKQYTAIQRVGDILFGESFTPNLPPGDIHLSATASVLRDSKGEIIAAIECIRDNTERKRLEERLNRSEKMEGLGRLAGGVAHDLNNVLGVLVGYSELLAEKLSEDNPLKRYAINIQQSSLRGAAIIQDLLTMARRGVTVSEVVDFNKVIFDYLRTPEFEALKSHHPNVKVWTELEEGLLNIKGSPVHLSKTIMNLVSNAAEAISDQGDLTIRLENRYLDRPIRGFDDLKEGDYVVLTVSDSGRGISSQDIGKIFEPFYTKKVMGKSGTGLGLAVVWGTVKDHNGYIDVQSDEGTGSTFTLYFPVAREELTPVKETVSPSMYLGRGESILVVDDVQEQRELAVSMLGRLGYQVEAVSGGEEAIDYLKDKKVDLVVLDMIMDPGIDGMETYRRILEIHPKQKAIIVSGFSETDRVKKSLEMGAGLFVRKPYILEKIGLAVKEELDRK